MDQSTIKGGKIMIPRKGLNAWCMICGKQFGSDHGFRIHFGLHHKSIKLPLKSFSEWKEAIDKEEVKHGN